MIRNIYCKENFRRKSLARADSIFLEGEKYIADFDISVFVFTDYEKQLGSYFITNKEGKKSKYYLWNIFESERKRKLNEIQKRSDKM